MRLTYVLKPLNSALLNEQLEALSIPGYAGWVITVAQQIGVDVADSTTSADQTRIANVVAAHDSTQLSSTGVNADGLTAAQIAALAAQSLDQPVTDLTTARSNYATDATALNNAKTAVTNANTTVQGLGAGATLAQVRDALKALSAAQAQADLAILNSLKDLADGELAMANALKALQARG